MLEVEDVHTDYGRSHVRQGVSLTIPDRAAIVVLGRNGVARPRSSPGRGAMPPDN
jgi:branched-chain amino acid transport system ATP-binding protein